MSMTEKKLPRILSIAQIHENYITDISYKKLKSFLLTYVPYKKVGNTYYFSKKKLEEFLEDEVCIEFDLEKYS